ncbi:MAG: hypothetical protein ACRDNZ_18740, partial [Streptosporangiaceae bacterium]
AQICAARAIGSKGRSSGLDTATTYRERGGDLPAALMQRGRRAGDTRVSASNDVNVRLLLIERQ